MGDISGGFGALFGVLLVVAIILLIIGVIRSVVLAGWRATKAVYRGDNAPPESINWNKVQPSRNPNGRLAFSETQCVKYGDAAMGELAVHAVQLEAAGDAALAQAIRSTIGAAQRNGTIDAHAHWVESGTAEKISQVIDAAEDLAASEADTARLNQLRLVYQIALFRF